MIKKNSLSIGVLLIVLSLIGTATYFSFINATNSQSEVYAAGSTSADSLILTNDTTECPNPIEGMSNSTPPDVVILPKQANTVIVARTGNIIEVRLPFGPRWNGPTVSQSLLEIQVPAGYASQTYNACVWRFVAKETGTALLTFTGQALCQPGHLCPLYIVAMSFTIDVT